MGPFASAEDIDQLLPPSLLCTTPCPDTKKYEPSVPRCIGCVSTSPPEYKYVPFGARFEPNVAPLSVVR